MYVFLIISEGVGFDHAPVVWSARKIIRFEHLLAVSCIVRMAQDWISVGLQEGTGSEPDEFLRECGVEVVPDKLLQKSQIGNISIAEDTKPFCFARMPESQPLIELFPGNEEAFTKTLHRMETCEALPENPKNKEKAVAGIRDNKIRQDGMGMLTAVAIDPENAEVIFRRRTLTKVDYMAPIVVMDTAVSLGTTDRAGLQFGAKANHEGIKD